MKIKKKKDDKKAWMKHCFLYANETEGVTRV